MGHQDRNVRVELSCSKYARVQSLSGAGWLETRLELERVLDAGGQMEV